jgi:Holliday junction DNA helicase RuvA
LKTRLCLEARKAFLADEVIGMAAIVSEKIKKANCPILSKRYDGLMIGYLEGKVVDASDRRLTILVGGVGYLVNVTPDTSKILRGVKKEIHLHTHLAVREDALDLYGFPTKDELEAFEMLIGVSGIGPRSALAILSIAPVETLRLAISSEDVSYLTKVSGIGKKTAEKIVLELKDKVSPVGSIASLKGEAEAIEALRALGYSASEAREALKKFSGEEVTTSERVRRALSHLGK